MQANMQDQVKVVDSNSRGKLVCSDRAGNTQHYPMDHAPGAGRMLSLCGVSEYRDLSGSSLLYPEFVKLHVAGHGPVCCCCVFCTT